MKSRANNGSKFSLYFPSVAEELPSHSEPELVEITPAPVPKAGQAPTILIAEDQAQVREMLELGLEQSGYNLIVGEDGVEALEKARAYQGQIDLILTDSMMPRMQGHRLIKHVRELYPDIKTVLMSGLPQSQCEELSELTLDAFVDKPFSIGKLIERIEHLLAAK